MSVASDIAAAPTTAEASVAAPSESARRPALFGRRVAIAGLLVGGALNTAETVVGRWVLPDIPDSPGRLIDYYAEHDAVIGALSTVGTLAIPFMVVGFLSMTHLLRRRMRRTAAAAAALLLAGMWGFAGVHLAEFMYHSVAEVGNTPSLREFVDVSGDNLYLGLLWGLPFLAGCVLGVITLAVGLLRSGVLPRWVGAALLGFIVLDFGAGKAVPVDPHWLYLLACSGAAWTIARMTDRDWANA